MKIYQKFLLGFGSASVLMLLAMTGAQAQTASNLVCEGCVNPQDIAAQAVNRLKIQDGAVNTRKLALGAVKTARIGAGAVTNPKIADGAVTLAKIAQGLLTERTELLGLGWNFDTTITDDYELLRTHGTFQKVRDDSDIKLIWTGHGFVDGRFCDFQLRIDGVAEDGDAEPTFNAAAGRAIIGPLGFLGNDGLTDQVGDSFAVTANWEGLAAGSSVVEMWVRGDANRCDINNYNFPMMVIVEEYVNPVVLFGDLLAVSSQKDLMDLGLDDVSSGQQGFE
jgi:hypothetical protein